jgi:hypothetical protein
MVLKLDGTVFLLYNLSFNYYQVCIYCFDNDTAVPLMSKIERPKQTIF